MLDLQIKLKYSGRWLPNKIHLEVKEKRIFIFIRFKLFPFPFTESEKGCNTTRANVTAPVLPWQGPPRVASYSALLDLAGLLVQTGCVRTNVF